MPGAGVDQSVQQEVTETDVLIIGKLAKNCSYM